MKLSDTCTGLSQEHFTRCLPFLFVITVDLQNMFWFAYEILPQQFLRAFLNSVCNSGKCCLEFSGMEWILVKGFCIFFSLFFSATRDSSNLLAHEAAFALGQMQDVEAIPTLVNVLKDMSLHPIVRHEVTPSLEHFIALPRFFLYIFSCAQLSLILRQLKLLEQLAWTVLFPF